MDDILEVLFASWWGLLGSAAVILLFLWIFLYLLSLRTQYSFKGKHILITGGSSGIGKAVAEESLKRGAAVVTLLARNKEKLENVKTELERLISAKLPQTVHIISSDVTLADSVKDDLESQLSGLPPVDVLVNSAGVSHSASFLDTSPQTFEEELRVNVLGSVYPTRALLPEMINRKQGRIVFISSMAGQMALHGYTAYSAAKYGVRGLAEVLDMELKVHNIRVSVSFPPDTDTPMLRAEVKIRSSIQAAQAQYGSVFEVESIARDICRGVERGRFFIHHGIDGFLLSTITAGMSPAYHWCTAVTEVLLLGVLRLGAFVYIALFYNIVNRELKKAKKNT